MDGRNPDKTRRRIMDRGNTALALALLALSIIALDEPVLAASDIRSCYEAFKGTLEMTRQCNAMIYSSWLRSALIVADEKATQTHLSVARVNRLCPDSDDAATCLARLDAIAGWTVDEAKRAAEEQVPGARQCFRYRTEALREARAANDYQRTEFLERHSPCCAEQEREMLRMEREYGRYALPGIDAPAGEATCPNPAPTPSTLARATAWTAQWRDWADYAIVILIVVGWVAFGVVPRTVYGLWWRRSWPRILIVGGAGILAWEVFGFFRPPRPDAAMFAVGAMMIAGGALNLRKARTASSPTDKPSGQGRNTDQTPK